MSEQPVSKPPNKLPRRLLWLLPAVLVLVLGTILLLNLRPYTFHGTVLQSPEPAPAFQLAASTGGEAGPADFEGKLVVLFFGYTFCPDICPTTLSTVARAMDTLEKDSDDVQVLFVSVDSGRDNPDTLAAYLKNFDPRFIGLTGTEEEIAAVTTRYGIFYELHEPDETGYYEVDHTATIMVLDRDGHLKLLLSNTIQSEDLAADLKQMLR